MGEGTTGIVKKCIKKTTREQFAVKIVRSNETEVLKSVKNEFNIQKKMDHPNIVQAYEMFFNPIRSTLFLVQEYVECIELVDHITKKGKFLGIY
jgi:serine/threonine protein kinase